jgi:hypothetical protein
VNLARRFQELAEAVMDQPILRVLIQGKLADGRLPHTHFPRVRSGPGNGEPCDGCEETVTKAQMLMENLDVRGYRVQFHVGCYYLWVVERQMCGQGDQRSLLPPSATRAN